MTDPVADVEFLAMDDAALLVSTYMQAKAQATEWAAVADQARKHLLEVMQGSDVVVGTIDGRPCIRRTRVRSESVDVAKLRAGYPDVVPFVSSSRVSDRLTLMEPDAQ